MSEMINVELLFGYGRLVQCQKALPDGSLLLGGYSIWHDREGHEVRRTEPTWNARLTDVRACLPEVYKAALAVP